ncbi:DUF7935 family protein [Daejeonella oryzae]|uniref:DUF7935 family protein n=1 Tax=Daejeonella oryzae TaxID=1122943 RepID=UPI00047DBCE4|nr:hypothetical protein [Daejeonella oryzae]
MIGLAFFSDILKFSISGILIFFAAWYFVREFVLQALEKKTAVIKPGFEQTLPLRLQAYERITLFLERINPSNMLLRLHLAGMSAREMQNMILSDIREEYQHNITQQIYVSYTAWATVQKMKDETVGMINNAVHGLPENASSVELSRVILTHLAKLDTANPYDEALKIVKRDIQQLF